VVKDGEAVVNEGGDSASYSVTITNTSGATDPVTITSVIDSVFGDLTADALADNGGNPIIIAPGSSFTNAVTVHGVDDEGTLSNNASDGHQLIAGGVDPAIKVVEAADRAFGRRASGAISARSSGTASSAIRQSPGQTSRASNCWPTMISTATAAMPTPTSYWAATMTRSRKRANSKSPLRMR
jgi:hypothetical protein